MSEGEEDTEGEITFQASLSKHGSSTGINIPAKVAKEYDLNPGEDVVISLARLPGGGDTLEEDFIQLYNKYREEQKGKERQEEWEEHKELFNEFKSQRLESALFLAYETIEETIDVPTDEEYEKPKAYTLKLEEGEKTRLPMDIAMTAEEEGYGVIIKDPPGPSEVLKEFQEWLDERKKYQRFLKLNPNLHKRYRKYVRSGGDLTFEEFALKEYERWKKEDFQIG